MARDGAGTILVVDDVPENVRLLDAVLAPRGYDVLTATSGQEALDIVAAVEPDLILLDVMMPGMDGYTVCETLRADEEHAVLPVIMVTSSIGPEKTKAIEAGADDFIPKPFNNHELLTRVRSLLRIKRYHDTIKTQAAELLELNRTLEERVEQQVDELERLGQLRRFLSPQLADSIVSSGDDSVLRSHRRQVAMLFVDLRGWTSFVDAVEPEELMRVLGEFHATIGGLVRRFDATVGFLEGDGVQLFFNDPVEVPDASLRAVRLACSLREEMAELTAQWRKRGYELGCGAGIALGYATCGEVGFEGRSDYAAIGTVTNLAARLADEAAADQILIPQRLYAEVEDAVEVEPAGAFTLRGFPRPVVAFNVLSVCEPEWGLERRPVGFGVLGPLEASNADGPLPLGGPKQRIVLAHLVLGANHVVPAEHLIDALWGEEPPEAARGTLQAYISRLRSAVGSNVIVGRTPGYLLRAEPDEIDALRFDALLREARGHPTEPRAISRTLAEALELWRGPALADLADEASLAGDIARLEELRLQATEEKIAADLELGRHAQVIAELESLTRAHPLRERFWGELMLALYRVDRQADALAAYQRAREVLADQLGVDPSPDLQRLHERILHQDHDLEVRGEPLRGHGLLEPIGGAALGVL